MNALLYDEWCNRRLDKIYGIFGKTWFAGKNILELGCGNGNIGIELTKLGSNVTFADARKEHLITVTDRLKSYNYIPDCAIIDQNKEYNFNKKFDMIIHFGVLYHLQNWRNDLRHALQHTDLMLLESSVFPVRDAGEKVNKHYCSSYESFDNHEPVFTQEHVEQELKNLGCKFLRIDDRKLNVEWSWYTQKSLIRFVYDWTYENYANGTYMYSGEYQYDVHYKRMWIVLK